MKPNAKPGTRPSASPNLKDYRSYPKGSLERKAAVAAMRRRNAAKIRSRPGASRKGVAKKVTDAEGRIHTPSQQSNGDNVTEAIDSCEANCSGGGWREQLADMRWVYGHPISQDETQGHK